MSEEETSRFTTKRRAIGSDDELKWGGEDGELWSEAVESSENITVSDDGTVTAVTDLPDRDFFDFEVVETSDTHDYEWFEGRFEAQVRKSDWSDGSVRIGTTGETYDLTNVDTIVFDHEFELPDGGIGLWIGIVKDENWDEYDENVHIEYWKYSSDLDRTEDHLDVSEWNGEWNLVVRFRSHANETGTTESSNWIYWTFYDFWFK